MRTIHLKFLELKKIVQQTRGMAGWFRQPASGSGPAGAGAGAGVDVESTIQYMWENPNQHNLITMFGSVIHYNVWQCYVPDIMVSPKTQNFQELSYAPPVVVGAAGVVPDGGKPFNKYSAARSALLNASRMACRTCCLRVIL